MDKTLSEIVKSFTHLVRDFFIYFISGFVVLLNALVIDYFYYDSSILNVLKGKELFLVGVILCYVMGHICMGFYYLLLERTKIHKYIKRRIGFVNKENEEKQPELYSKKPMLYNYFIERYDNLSLFRWNLSASFLISFFINFVYCFKQDYWQIIFLKLLCLVFAVILYLLALETEKDYINRIYR